MNEEDFPSGPWTGFYNYSGEPRKHRMGLSLTFAQGNLTGEGNDDIGAFIVRGSYDSKTKECYWTKTYVGAHDVFYRGFREGKGIWGTWELPDAKGGFHIWPLGQGEDDGESMSEAEDKSLEEARTLVGVRTNHGSRIINQ